MQDHRSTQSSENQPGVGAIALDADPLITTLPGFRLNLPVSPQLEAAVGYRGDARYFSIFWRLATKRSSVMAAPLMTAVGGAIKPLSIIPSSCWP